MKRGQRYEGLTEGEKLCCTAGNIAEAILECWELKDYNYNMASYRDDPGSVRDAIGDQLHEWMDEMSERAVIDGLRQLYQQSFSAFYSASQIVDPKYYKYFTQANPMTQTKANTGTYFKYANDMARSNPFFHGRKTPEFRRTRYGETRVAVLRPMPERTEKTFVTMMKMAGQPGKVIECHLKDIARERGASESNLANENVMGPLRQDIELLLSNGVSVNIDRNNPSPKKRLRFHDTLIHGEIDDQDWVAFDISHHLARMMELTGYFFINHKDYLSFRSGVARKSFLFLSSHRAIQRSKKYEISVKKLCNYIGWVVGGQWKTVRATLNGALEEVLGRGLIKMFQVDTTRRKDEGGVVVFNGRKPKKTTINLPAGTS